MAQYSEDTKAAVMAALLTGQSVSQVAREYDIPKGTVNSWKQRNMRDFATQKRERIGELLVSYLSTSLETLEAQARMFSNEEWLKKQNAADVAVLHGVVTDKAIRLLEALAHQSE
jgi:transposase-like protein